VKALTHKQTVKILVRNGFVLVRQRGSHQIYRHNVSGKLVPVPLHPGNNPLKTGTFLAIVKQSGLSPELFNRK
jgi:predicted RNA binding protein YcfA (HicA-like mRNA interferase family)